MGDDLTKYRRSVDALFARTTGKSKFGLERTEALLAALGNPHLRLPTFHVAGTNGKGSVCASLDVMLRAQGHTVGRYTSPHLVDFRERFLVNGTPIPESFVVEFIERWTPTVEALGATFFEATTAMAFEYFVTSNVTAAVIEAGLGGRLDSTNVVQPMVATVTSIALDHTEVLGDTLEQIADEKAGIFKRGSSAVIGETAPAIAARLATRAWTAEVASCIVVPEVAQVSDVEVRGDGTRFSMMGDGQRRIVHTPLSGAHQAANASVALYTLRAAGDGFWPGWESASAALRGVSLPGRFHQVGKFIFDVAHNPDGSRVLVSTLRAVAPPGPVSAVLCVLSDKDWRGVMRTLSACVDHFVLTMAPTAPPSRTWDLAEATRYAREQGYQATPVRDFTDAIRMAEESGATVLITGSFHTVGDAMDRLQVDPLGR